MRILIILAFVLIFAFSASAQPVSDSAVFSEGATLAKNGNHQKALEKFRAISTAEKSDFFVARVHYNIGVCLYQLGRHGEAIAEYHSAISLDAKYQKAYYALGMAQAASNNRAEAKSAFREALKLNSQDAEAWFDLAMVLLADREFDSAKLAFEKAIENKSVSAAEAMNNLGVLLALDGDLDQAAEKFKNAWAMSGGASREAIANFNICVRYKQKADYQFTAELKFSSDRSNTGE